MKLVLCNFVLKKAVIFYYSEHRQSALSIHVGPKHSLDGPSYHEASVV